MTDDGADGLYWFGECASVTAWTVAATGVTSGLVSGK